MRRRELLPGVPLVQVSYGAYRETAHDCDLLLWTPTSGFGRLIAAATGGPFSHVSAAVWWSGRLMDVGYQEGEGGRAKPLRVLVERHPGACHVFRAEHLTIGHRAEVRRRLVDELGGDYAWSSLRLIWLAWLPGLRLLTQCWPLSGWIERASRNCVSRVCSRHIRDCFCPHVMFSWKPAALVTPNDIGQSGCVRYLGSLWPDEGVK